MGGPMQALEIATVVLLGLIAAGVGALIFATWRLGDGLRAVLKMMPAIALLERVLATPERPVGVRPAAAGLMAPDGGAGVYLPHDLENQGNGTFTPPAVGEEEIAAMLMRNQAGR